MYCAPSKYHKFHKKCICANTPNEVVWRCIHCGITYTHELSQQQVFRCYDCGNSQFKRESHGQ